MADPRIESVASGRNRLLARFFFHYKATFSGGNMISGCYTAMVTPFDGAAVDETGLSRLADFQIQNGITGLLAVGTTGESPTLAWQEHHRVVQIISQRAKGKCLCIAGAGSNNTEEALSATRHAAEAGVDAVLLVDPVLQRPQFAGDQKGIRGSGGHGLSRFIDHSLCHPGEDRRPVAARRPGSAV
jgi:phosphoketolase